MTTRDGLIERVEAAADFDDRHGFVMSTVGTATLRALIALAKRAEGMREALESIHSRGEAAGGNWYSDCARAALSDPSDQTDAGSGENEAGWPLAHAGGTPEPVAPINAAAEGSPTMPDEIWLVGPCTNGLPQAVCPTDGLDPPRTRYVRADLSPQGATWPDHHAAPWLKRALGLLADDQLGGVVGMRRFAHEALLNPRGAVEAHTRGDYASVDGVLAMAQGKSLAAGPPPSPAVSEGEVEAGIDAFTEAGKAYAAAHGDTRSEPPPEWRDAVRPMIRAALEQFAALRLGRV